MDVNWKKSWVWKYPTKLKRFLNLLLMIFWREKMSLSKWSDIWKWWNCYIESSFRILLSCRSYLLQSIWRYGSFYCWITGGRLYDIVYIASLRKNPQNFVYLSGNQSFMFEFLNIWKFENRIVNWIQFRIWKIMGLIKYSWRCPESSTARIRIEIKYWVPTLESQCSYDTILYWLWYRASIIGLIFEKTVHRIPIKTVS